MFARASRSVGIDGAREQETTNCYRLDRRYRTLSWSYFWRVELVLPFRSVTKVPFWSSVFLARDHVNVHTGVLSKLVRI